MDNKDEKIVGERILKFLMFAIATFCTGGLFFGAYVFYHIVMCDKEIQENKTKKLKIYERPEIIRINQPENLTEEDKRYFFHNPYAFKIIPQCKDSEPYLVSECLYKARRYDFVSQNPRFHYKEYRDEWWNRKYWSGVFRARESALEKEMRLVKNSLSLNSKLLSEAKENLLNCDDSDKEHLTHCVEEYEKEVEDSYKFMELLKRIFSEDNDYSYVGGGYKECQEDKKESNN